MAKWLDEWRLAFLGLLMAAKKWKFWIVAILVFLFFGVLMVFLQGGLDALTLITPHTIWKAFLGLFCVGINFWDWLPIFLIAVLQGVLIALVVLVWKKKRDASSEGLQNAGIAAGLAVLGSGCPTCQTALLTPIIGALFSGCSALVATAISSIVTIAAIILALLTFKKIGEEAYVIMISEKFVKKKKVEEDEKGN